MYINNTDIDIEEVDCGSRWLGKYTGIRLIHTPTGTTAESLDKDLSIYGNYYVAVAYLIAKLGHKEQRELF